MTILRGKAIRQRGKYFQRRDELESLPVLPVITEILLPMRKFLEVLLFIMTFVVAIYTGFLLSAMNSYPMHNTAVLPALFLFSALSAGAAANNLVSVLLFRADLREEQYFRRY